MFKTPSREKIALNSHRVSACQWSLENANSIPTEEDNTHFVNIIEEIFLPLGNGLRAGLEELYFYAIGVIFFRLYMHMVLS